MKSVSDAVSKSKKSSIRKLFELVLKAKNAISFGIGQPDFTPPQHVLDAISKAVLERKTMYAPTLGLPDLCSLVAEKFRKENGLGWVDSKNIIITNGGSHAIQLAYAAVSNPGDEMVLSSPNFLSYYYVGSFYQLNVKEVRRNPDFSPNFAGIRKAITPKTKFIVLNSPNNPTGYTYTKAQMDDLVKIVLENDLYLISDEVYERFIYGNAQHVSPASYPGMENRTLTLNAMSKTFAGPGLRLGYIAAPENIIELMEKYAQYTAAGVSHPTQYGAIAAFKLGNPELPLKIKEYDKKRQFCVKRLKELKFSVVEPLGAFYIMPKIPEMGLKSEEFSEQLMKEVEVAVVPGSGFGSYSDDRIRISYATGDQKLEEGFNRIEKFLKNRGIV